MTIYMPQNPWAKMMPQLIGQMAMAKFQQSLRPEAEAEDYTLGPGQTRFRGKEKLGSLPPTEKEKKDKGTWSQLTPFKIGGATVYPQQHSVTKKVEYNRFPPKATKGGAGAKGQTLVGKQQAELRQINAILKKAGIKQIDIVTFAGLSAEEQRKYMETQTKPLIGRVPKEYRPKLLQHYKLTF